MIVAAVCYRRTRSGVEFLLVHTSGGDLWTFPKGHVEPGESGVDAAKREAREEAGVTGKVDPSPLGEYLYPGGSGPEAHERTVTAYLLEVETQDVPEEDWRKPTWCDPRGAMSRLAERRDPRYAEGHARILDAARTRLASTG